ncbi:hypothetical protein V491_09028 [Pseudogymnoascus sp. VKM F-3775]|nr:hypothetical protein V491_09028 [Pseudogymnoascus sp. VKM F-3775]
MPHDRHEAKTVPDLAREGSAKVPSSLTYPDILKAKPLIIRAELSKIHVNRPMTAVNSPEFGGRPVLGEVPPKVWL